MFPSRPSRCRAETASAGVFIPNAPSGRFCQPTILGCAGTSLIANPKKNFWANPALKGARNQTHVRSEHFGSEENSITCIPLTASELAQTIQELAVFRKANCFRNALRISPLLCYRSVIYTSHNLKMLDTDAKNARESARAAIHGDAVAQDKERMDAASARGHSIAEAGVKEPSHVGAAPSEKPPSRNETGGCTYCWRNGAKTNRPQIP